MVIGGLGGLGVGGWVFLGSGGQNKHSVSGPLPRYRLTTSGTQYWMPTCFFWTPNIKQGKGTANHMPFGDWLNLVLHRGIPIYNFYVYQARNMYYRSDY